MQAVILASESLSIARSKTNGLPVSLLPVAKRPVIEHILRFLCSDDCVGKIHICTGSGGYQQFIEWLRGCDYTGRVELFNGNHNTGGIIAELLNFTSKKNMQEDLLVLPGDHIPDFQAGPFLTEYVLDGNDTRRIESFLAWSYRIRPLYAFLEDGGRYQGLSEAPLKKISSKGSPAGKLSRA